MIPSELKVHQISKRFGYKDTIVAKSDASNTARQRNIGLQFADAPVVMFPDDDFDVVRRLCS